jgi:MftR C-terminal domain
VAASRHSDPATDLQARVTARAVWSATRAAREIWVASHATRDPRTLVNQAFDLLEHGLRQSEPAARDEKPHRMIHGY